LRNIFQWTDDDEGASGYASTSTVSSIRTRTVSAYMAENEDLRRRMDEQDKVIKIQQETLSNIQLLLAELLKGKNQDTNNGNNSEANLNSNAGGENSSNHEEEEFRLNPPPKNTNLLRTEHLQSAVMLLKTSKPNSPLFPKETG